MHAVATEKWTTVAPCKLILRQVQNVDSIIKTAIGNSVESYYKLLLKTTTTHTFSSPQACPKRDVSLSCLSEE